MSDCEFAYIGRKNILFENKEVKENICIYIYICVYKIKKKKFNTKLLNDRNT